MPTRRTASRRPASRSESRQRPASRKGLSAQTFKGLNPQRMKSKGGGGGNRTIIKQGETAPVQFLNSVKEFEEFDQHQWREDGTWYYVPCLGDDCPLCDDEDEVRAKKHYKFIACVYNLKTKKVEVLEGPKTLATQIFYRYKRQPARFMKRVWDVTKFPTEIVSYGFAPADEAPVRVAGLKRLDLMEHIQAAVDRYFGDGGLQSKSKKKRRSSLDDEDFEDEDEFEDDEDEEFDEEEEDEEDSDEEAPDEDEMLDKDAWPWSDLKEYGRDVGLKRDYTKRSELVRAILKKRG